MLVYNWQKFAAPPQTPQSVLLMTRHVARSTSNLQKQAPSSRTWATRERGAVFKDAGHAPPHAL